jgi:hypothetical protein
MRLSPVFRLVSVLALTLGFASVARAQDVSYNAMPNTDFAKFKTYKWVDIKDAQKPDQITDQQIKSAIDAELAKKGLTKTTGDTADLYIGYQASIAQEKQWYGYDMGGGWGYGWPGYGGGMGTTQMTSETINIGSIDLDMYDRAAKQLVWRGKASKTLDPGAKPDKRQKNIDKAMAKMLKNYPPPVKK